MRRGTVIDSSASVFQFGFEKYESWCCWTRWFVINGAFSGGPAGLLYGFIVVWAGTAAVFASLSELASMYAYIDTIQLFLTSAGHLPLEASITGSPCSRHVLRKSCLATSQVGSNHCDEVLWALMSQRLAYRLGMAG